MKKQKENLRIIIAREAVNLIGFPARNHPQESEDHFLGCSPNTGFDCSGFIVYLLSSSGISLNKGIRHASQIYDTVGIPAQAGYIGDLVFFSENGLWPKHVGVMINNREYVHSEGKNGGRVILSELTKADIPRQHEYQFYFTNPIGFKIIVGNYGGRWKQTLPYPRTI